MIFDKGTGRWLKEVGEEVSIDQIRGWEWGDGVDDRGRWCQRWDGGNWCNNDGRGKFFDGDVFVESEGVEWLTFDNVRGAVGNGGDVLGRDEVLFVDSGGVGELDDQIVEVVTGELLGGNVSEDVKEGLVVDKGGRRARGKDRSGGRRGAAGVSGGWEVPGIVGTVEEVLDFLGGGGEVGCVDVVDGRPVE